MNEPSPSDEVQTRLTKRATNFKPQLPRKLAELLPFKTQIKELRTRNAAYDDIRLILAQENIIVTLDAVYRFCRVVLGEKSNEPKKARSVKVSPPASSLAAPPPTDPQSHPVSIEAALREQRRERLPGLWGRRKRGPRIADSKNL
jgi:hypothetical protein